MLLVLILPLHAKNATEGVKAAFQLQGEATLIDLAMQAFQDRLQLHLLERVFRVQVKLGPHHYFDHLLGPRADRCDVEAVADVDLLSASLDVVEDGQGVALLLLVLDPIAVLFNLLLLRLLLRQ